MAYLGIEIGGTKLQGAVGDARGDLQFLQRVPARARGGREAITTQVADLARECLAAAHAEGVAVERIGIGFGGPVDPVRGVTRKSHQVDGWDDFPLAEFVEREVGLPTVLGNDSDLAGLGEAHFGAGVGKARVVYMNVGSGIGGAVVLDGKLYMSQGAGASEIGHLRIRPSHPGTPWQTLEDLASGWSLARAARKAAELHPDSKLAELVDDQLDRITTETLVRALEPRDPIAVDVWLRAVEHLGVAIANVITLLRPEVVVVGGGVSLVGDLLFKPLRREVAQQVFPPFADSYEILPAALGEEVVLHGAVLWARDAP